MRIRATKGSRADIEGAELQVAVAVGSGQGNRGVYVLDMVVEVAGRAGREQSRFRIC